MSDSKTLLHKLQRDPADLVTLRQLKKQLLQERRVKGLAQVIEWWAKRAPTKEQGAQELYEVALAMETRARMPERAIELYEAALTYHPSHAAAQARLSSLRPDQEFDALLDALEGDSVHPPPSAAPRGHETPAPRGDRAHPSPATSQPPSFTAGAAAQPPQTPAPQLSDPPRRRARLSTSPRAARAAQTGLAQPTRAMRAPSASSAAAARPSDRPVASARAHSPIPSLRSVPPVSPSQPAFESLPGLDDEEERDTSRHDRPAPRSAAAPVSARVSATAQPSAQRPSTTRSPLPPLPSSRPPASPQPPLPSPAATAYRAVPTTGRVSSTPPQLPSQRVSSTPPVLPEAPVSNTPPSRHAPRPSAPTTPGKPSRASTPSAPPDGFEPHLYADEEDEDERSEAHFGVGAILAQPAPPATHGPYRLEVVRSRGDSVLGAEHVRLWGNGGTVGLKLRRAGASAFRVTPPPSATGVLRSANGQSGPIEQQPLRLVAGDVAELNIDGVNHRLRVIRMGSPPVTRVSNWHVGRYAGAIAAALLVHALGMVGLLIMQAEGVTFAVESRSREEIFAEAKLAPPDKKAPKPPPRPKPIKLRKRPKPDRPAPSEEQAKIPNSVRKRLKTIARTRARSSKNSVDRLVSALTSPHAGEGKTVKDVVSNIEAVAGSEKSASFRVGGTLAGIKGVGPNVASGGGGEVGTLGGSEATGSLKRLTAARRSGGVRGKVSTISALAKVQGSLSRSEVLKVLNANQRKVQRCYERALTSKPQLSGRLTFSWTIKTNGRVGDVRQSASTLGDNNVSKCIGSVIKSMRFPEPKGGPVTITFPWIFTRAT